MLSATEMKQHISDFDQRLDSAKNFVTESRSRLRAIDPAKTQPEQRLGGNLIKLMHLPISEGASYTAFRRKLMAQVHPDKFRAANDPDVLSHARDTLDKTESLLQEFHLETLWNHFIDTSSAPVKSIQLDEASTKQRVDTLFNQLAQLVRTRPDFTPDDTCEFMNRIKVLEQPESVQSGLFCRLMGALRSGGTDRVRKICAEATTLLLCIPQFMLTQSIQNEYKPLLVALKLGLPDLTQELLQRDETLINLTDEDLNTALHLAVLRNDEDCVANILEKKELDLSLKNSFGDTALDTARELNNPKIIGMILNKL